MRKFLGGLAAILLIGILVSPAFAGAEKVYVCHAAGRADTTQYVTLEVPATESGFPQGHFTENGTSEAGHEEDYLGQCSTASPSPTPTGPTITPTPVPSTEPTPTPTASATPTTEPSFTPTPEPTFTSPPVPTATLPPTDTSSEPVSTASLLAIALGLALLVGALALTQRSKSK